MSRAAELSASPVGFPAARRLLTPAQFTATVARDATVADATWRSGRRYLAAQARVMPEPRRDSAPADAPPAVPTTDRFPAAMDPAPGTRFGLTVGKRNARRSVDRALVKRVLRESARHAAIALDAAAAPRRVDVVLRLKAPLPARASLARVELKRVLRQEADSLLQQLAGWLRGAPAAASAT